MIVNYLADRAGIGPSQWMTPGSQVSYGSTAPQPSGVQQGTVAPGPSAVGYGSIGIDLGEPNMGAPVSEMSLPDALGAGSWGNTLGTLGTVGGMLSGVAGLGALGALAGTGADFFSGQQTIDSYNDNPQGGVQAANLNFTDALSGFLNSMTSGFFGTPIETSVQTGIANAIAEATNTGLTPGFTGGFGFDGFGMDSGGYGGLGPDGADFGGGYGL